MRNTTLVVVLVILSLAAACSDTTKPKTKDPLESLAYEYIGFVKAKNFDGAYNMLSNETRRYYPKEEFIEYATSFILPKVDAVYVTRLEKRKLDATVFTEFKPRSSWATYNTMEQAKIKLFVVYKEGKWLIHMTDIVEKAREKEEREKERLARVAEWKPHLEFHEFRVENQITDEGPMLVFHGEIENKSEKLCEMVMVMIDFYDGKGAKANLVGEAADCEARDEKTRDVTLQANKETPVPVLIDPDFDGPEIEIRVSDPESRVVWAKHKLKNAMLE